MKRLGIHCLILGIVFNLLCGALQKSRTNETIAQVAPNPQFDFDDSALEAFCLNATTPDLGVNAISLHGTPTSTVCLYLERAWENAELAKSVDLTQEQLEAFVNKWDEFQGSKPIGPTADETKVWVGIYDGLNGSQRHKLELLGLITDGSRALTRPYFSQQLQLSETQINKMNARLSAILEGDVKKRFQRNFGLSGTFRHGQFDAWEQTKVAIKFNQYIVGTLTDEQRNRLSQLLAEAEAMKELRTQFLIVYFFSERRQGQNCP